ncbi:Uncharacterized protein ALO43_01748 [Pseudomonas tremae]|uniref:Uncharacterized protein n=1 Tax=Pseudomonas tremae TaxID=200454 RepID=A0AA40P8N1_9PSED|nr:Uncharacterized protein AC511_3602 [Pseudomonas coronafaciens pv. oryzae]KPW42047.1 Uncharacterized protein ALO66_00528 [Pseudomonas coronafaciens pv. atropurpurea]KPZ05996.1 Uncharacterized protein ALO43_01748 [Pseudomonas tremae]RMN30309.1 hypothetical protein ALQ61_01948 [Pseudomonas coronafaciens pv. zizaniae]RMN95399.1 hypothetical protein ALQ50_02197 [Pseudomonas coronafaciens pv. coronafaciens]RMU86707.1 hypothetical protein ALP22_04284 [Pseudomonas coronafaciens pv. porri]
MQSQAAHICPRAGVAGNCHKVVCRTGDFVSQGNSLAPRAVPRPFRLAGLFSFARKGMFAH